MLRTVVYDGPSQPRGRGLRAKGGATEPSPKDGYLEKLVKYVPAEVLAVFVPLSAAAKEKRTLAWIVFAVGLLGTVGYLLFHADSLPKRKRPTWYFYLLAAAAFVFWSAGSSETVRGLFKVSATDTEIYLGISVVTLPLVDWLLGKIFPGTRSGRRA